MLTTCSKATAQKDEQVAEVSRQAAEIERFKALLARNSRIKGFSLVYPKQARRIRLYEEQAYFSIFCLYAS